MSDNYPLPSPYPTTGVGQTPSPWFTIANQFLPRNLHDVIRWARYITIQSPVTTEVIRKLATYPITQFLVDSKDEKTKEKYDEVFRSFKLKQGLQDIGFDHFTIGNVFLSIYFPIHRTLSCPACKTEYNAKTAEFLTFKTYQFIGKCPVPQCSYMGPFQRKESKSLNIADMNLIKWNPQHIAVNYNSITGESEYYYKIPNEIKRKVMQGDKLFVSSVPWGFIDAIKHNQDFKFDAQNIFHLRNLSAGGMVEGISVPPLISLFSLVFYQSTLMRANESVANEFLQPLRVVFPQPSNANADPIVSMSMKNFVSNMEDALKKHKQDPNHFLIAPVPIGYESIGGDGKNLLVSQEIAQAEESILLALGVSKELLSGTTNWTSSTIGLRMLENTLFGYVSQLEDLIQWVMTKVCVYLSLEVCKVTLEPFKLMDDDAGRQNLAALVESGNASISTLFETMGLDFEEEMTKRKEDLVTKAKTEIETKWEIEQAQFLTSKNLMEKLDETSDFQKILANSQTIANQLHGADPTTRQSTLTQLRIADYSIYMMVEKLLNEYDFSNQQATAGTSDKPSKEKEKGVPPVSQDASAQSVENDLPRAEDAEGATPPKDMPSPITANKKLTNKPPSKGKKK